MSLQERQARVYNKDSATYDSEWSHYLSHSLSRTTHSLALWISDCANSSNNKSSDSESVGGNDTRTLRIADIGCGTGLLIHNLLSRLASTLPDGPTDTHIHLDITGIDPAQDMLEKAIHRSYPPSGSPARLSYSLSLLPMSLFQNTLPSASFDALVSTNALHFCCLSHPSGNDPLPAAFREFARLLVPTSGRLFLTDWSNEFLSTRMITWSLSLSRSAYAANAFTRDEVINAAKAAGLTLQNGPME